MFLTIFPSKMFEGNLKNLSLIFSYSHNRFRLQGKWMLVVGSSRVSDEQREQKRKMSILLKLISDGCIVQELERKSIYNNNDAIQTYKLKNVLSHQSSYTWLKATNKLWEQKWWKVNLRKNKKAHHASKNAAQVSRLLHWLQDMTSYQLILAKYLGNT